MGLPSIYAGPLTVHGRVLAFFDSDCIYGSVETKETRKCHAQSAYVRLVDHLVMSEGRRLVDDLACKFHAKLFEELIHDSRELESPKFMVYKK